MPRGVYTRTLEYREKLRVATTRGWKDPEIRERRMQGLRRVQSGPKDLEAMSVTMTEAYAKPERRRMLSDRMKARWADSEEAKRLLIVMKVGSNKAEQQLFDIVAPFGFQFSGGGALVVDGKIPDFWDGGTRLVELYGDYWHRGQDPQERIDFFKVRGYGYLVIWEHELKDSDTIREKVRGI